MAVRAFMVLAFWPLLGRVGKPFHWKEGVIVVWSGLRGAVGLALAVIAALEPEIDKAMGAKMMFHVGGIAALTTLVNATTCAPMLQALKLTKTDRQKLRMLAQLKL